MPSYHKGWIDIHKCILKQKLSIAGPGRDKYNVIFFPLSHELFSTIPFQLKFCGPGRFVEYCTLKAANHSIDLLTSIAIDTCNYRTYTYQVNILCS